MTDKENDTRNKSGDPTDTDESLEKELAREAAEGADSIGGVGSNRTLSGSSSWETLPESPAGDPKSGKEPSEKTE